MACNGYPEDAVTETDFLVKAKDELDDLASRVILDDGSDAQADLDNMQDKAKALAESARWYNTDDGDELASQLDELADYIGEQVRELEEGDNKGAWIDRHGAHVMAHMEGVMYDIETDIAALGV